MKKLYVSFLILTVFLLFGCESAREKAARIEKQRQETLVREQEKKIAIEKQEKEEEARLLKEKFGDEIECKQVLEKKDVWAYAMGISMPIPISEQPNLISIKNMRMYINRKTGNVTMFIEPDYEVLSSSRLTSCKIGIEFYDKNDQEITEWLSPGVYGSEHMWGHFDKFIYYAASRERLIKRGLYNLMPDAGEYCLNFTINMRDTQYIHKAVFYWRSLQRDYGLGYL